MAKHRANCTEKMPILCNSVECLRAAADILQFIDHSIEPCDDFYDFACGKFVNNTIQSPDGEKLFEQRNLIDEKINLQLHRLLDSASDLNESKY